MILNSISRKHSQCLFSDKKITKHLEGLSVGLIVFLFPCQSSTYCHKVLGFAWFIERVNDFKFHGKCLSCDLHFFFVEKGHINTWLIRNINTIINRFTPQSISFYFSSKTSAFYFKYLSLPK